MTQEQQISNIAAKLHITERKAWELYHESGLKYIENLKQAIVHFNIFKSQFGSLIQSGALDGLSVPETFHKLSIAPEFWEWWMGQLWNEACNNYQFQTIPINVITKIFNNNDSKSAKQEKPSYRKTSVTKFKAQIINS